MKTFACNFGSAVTCTVQISDQMPAAGTGHILNVQWTGSPTPMSTERAELETALATWRFMNIASDAILKCCTRSHDDSERILRVVLWSCEATRRHLLGLS